ncbi:MAG: fibronectin type III domain-containing protein [Bacteroidales bacterium]|jgi:hypothetical protein
MKRLLFILMAMIFAIQVWGQTPYTATIGSGTSTTTYLPIYGYTAYNYSQQIYTQPEINTKGEITKIRFYYVSGGSLETIKDWVVYLGHTTKTSFSSTTDWVPLTELTEVFNGEINLPSATGWMEIILTTPFVYNNTDNLVVAVDENTAGGVTTTWRQYSSASNRSIAYRNATTNPDPSAPPTATARYSYCNQIQFDIIESCPRPSELAGSNITPYTANFSWTNGNSSNNAWILYYKMASDAEYNSVNISSNPYTLTGLTSNSNYTAYLKTSCGIESSTSTNILNFGTLSNCPAPANLMINPGNLSAHAAIINWTAGGTETQWTIQYKPTTVTDWANATVKIANSNSVLLNELAENTNYELRIKSNCTTSDISWSTTLNFSTPYGCPRPTNLTNIESDLTYSSAKLNWNRGGEEAQWVIEYKLSTITDWNYATTFYSNDTTVTISGLNENTTYNVKVKAICNGNDEMIFTNPISFTTPFLCPPPTQLSANTATESSIELNWTNGGSETQWTLEYKESNQDWSNSTSVNVASKPYTINGLNPASAYNFRIKASCGGENQSAWSNEISRSTSIVIIPWIETFDTYTSGVFPPSWSRPIVYSTYPKTSSSYYYNAPTSLEIHSASALLPTYAVTPSFNVNINTLRVRFQLKAESTTSSGTMEVGVMSNPNDTNTFELVQTIQPTTTSFTQYEVQLNNTLLTGSNKYIAFRQKTVSSSYYYWIDDVIVDLIPTCYPPTNINASNVGSSQATLNWTPNGTESKWALQYKLSTELDWTNSTTINNVTTNPYTLTGLSNSSSYSVRIKSNCSTIDSSEWSNSITLSTSYSIPFNQNFSSTTFPPTNWACLTGLASAAFTGTLPTTTTSGWVSISGGNGISNAHAKTNIYGTAWNYWLVSPSIDLGSSTNNVLNFDLALTAYNSASAPSLLGTDDKFMVIISTDNGATWAQANATIWDNAGSTNIYNNISTTGQEISINLSSYANQSVKIAFYGESTAANADNDLHIGNIYVGPAITCPSPKNLAVNNTTITATTATLNWTLRGTETTWAIQYKTAAATEWTIVNATTNPYTLTGLTPSTTYNVKIKAVCGVGDESYNTEEISFTTAFNANLLFSENFSNTTFPPTDWTRLNGLASAAFTGTNPITTTSGWVRYTNAYGLTAPHSKINVYGTSCKYWLVSPTIDMGAFNASTNVAFLTFKLAQTAYNSSSAASGTRTDDKFMVIVSTDNGATWSQANATIWDNAGSSLVFNNIPSTGQNITIDLANYVNNPIKIAFYGESTTSGNGDNDIHIGNIFVYGPAVTCPKPTSIAINHSSVTTTSATINWTNGGAETEWTIQYKPITDIDWNNATSVIASNNPFTLTGLNANTTYNVRVLANCSPTDQSSYSKEFTFSTASTIPYVENFDTYGTGTSKYPSAWSRISTYGTSPYPNSSYYVSSPASLYFYSSSTTYTIGITPKINPTININTLRAKFKLLKTSDVYSIKIGVMTSPTDTNSFVQIGDTLSPRLLNTWQDYEVSFGSYAGNGHYIAFKCGSTITSAMYVDNLEISSIPSCQTPTNITASSITTTDANINWNTLNETEWIIQYKLSTEANWANSVTINNITTNSQTISGLFANSSYDVRLKAICSPTDQSDWTNITFRTACGMISTLPWSDSFDTYGSGSTVQPNCWTRITTNSSYPYIYNNTYNTPPASMYFYITSLTGYEIMTTPQFDESINLNTLRVKFKLYSSSSSTRMKVGIMDNPNDSTTFSQIAEVYPSSTSTWQEFDLQLNNYTGNGKYLSFKFYTGSTYTSMYLDNLVVSLIPTCFEPTALNTTNNNTTSVDLNWTPTGSGTAWSIQYKPSSDTSWINATTINTTTNPYSLSGLAVATSYDWRIKTVCSQNDQSFWSSTSSFSTLSPISSLPFECDFENINQNSTYWLINNGDQVNKWFIGNVGGKTGNGLYISDDANGTTLNYNILTTTITHASTNIQFGSTENYELTFDWKAYGESTYDYINVYLLPASELLVPGTLPNSSYALATNVNLDSIWKTKKIIISGTLVNNSIRKLVFVWKNDGSAGTLPPAAIDNIKLNDCISPSGLVVVDTTISQTNATIKWNAGGNESEWVVEYKLQNAPSWTIINNVSDTNYTFTTLNHTSVYNVRVKAVCSTTTQSNYSNIISFNTACGTYDPLTLSTDFTTMLPNTCWEKRVGLLTNSCTPTTTTGGWIASTVLPGYAKATMYRNNMSWLITPALDLGQGNIFYQLEFDAALTTFASINNPNYNNFDDKFILAISNDNGETWSNANVCKMYDQNGNPLLLNSLNPTPSHVFVKLVYDDGTPFTGNVKLGFYVESTIANAVNDLHINNISFSTYCPEPTAISTIPYTDRVDVRWTGNTNKNNLEIKLNEGTPIAINNVNNYTFNNLSQSNEYTVSVRTVCSNTNQYSEWVSNTFTTQVSPQVSTNDATEIAETSITLNGYVTDGSEFISAKGFEYKKASETDWITVTATNQPLVYNLTGLDDGEDYEFRAFATTPSYPFYGDIKTFHTPVAPEVITDPSTEILQTSVTLNGSVTPGENPISNYGYEYRVVNANSWTILPINATPLTYTLSSLQTGTNYEYRAFATTTSGTTYGNVETFTTQTPVDLYTEDITNLSQNSATLNANLIQGSETISEFGFEWKATSATEYNIVPLTNINSLTYNLTSLLLNVSYDFRPYVVTPSGRFYGENKTFITLNPPTVLTTLASNLTSTSALLNATIIEGTDAMLAFGIEWKLASSQEWTTIPLTVSNPLTYELTGLSATTEYSYRAYSTVALTTIYGNTVNFTTLAEGINQPTVTTSQATNITQTLATISGNVTAGDKSIIEKGFEWKQANVPTWTVVPDSDLSFNFMDLAPGTSFNVRAYAITEDGTSYGSIETFSTLAAELVTMSISSISQTDANVSWAPINNAIGYRVNVYQAGVLITGYPQTLTSTTFDLIGLRSNTNFTVKIETQYTATRFSAFASNNFTTLQYPAPNVSITNTTQTSLTASWIANQTSGAKFNISLYQGETLVHIFTEQTATSMTLDLLNPSTTYTINVTEIYNTDELSVTATELNTTLATETPLVSDTTVVYNSVTINWSPMSNVISYKIYLYNENGDVIDSAFINNNMNNVQGQERMPIGLHVTFIGLSSSTNYTAAIYGVYQGNVLSDPLLINFSTPYYEYPNPMYIKTSNVAPTSVTLNGRVSAGQEPTAIKGFLYRELGSTNWDSVVVAVADTNFTYNLTGLSINSLYQVRVFAKNPSGTFYSPILGFRTGRTNVIVPNATNRIIRNTADLIAASSYVNLGNTNVNLYFDVTVSPISGSGFTTSIGQTASFSGSIKFVDASNQEVIDGNITIDGLNIPLFHITSGAVIENINLTNVNITGRNASLIEYSDNTIIRNCNAENGTVNSTSDNAGGLVGEITNCSSVESCSANINVTGLNYVGGIVGNNASCAITKSYSTGDVAGNDYVGSFAGYNQGGTIFKSYSTGSVNSTTIPTVNVNFGAFVGGGNGNETKCYWLETILSNINANIPNAIYNYRGTPKNAIEVIRAVD